MKFVDQKIEDYAVSKSTIPSHHCQQIESYTKENVPLAQMLVGPLEASLFGFLIRSIGVKHILEFGTYTGYSALAMAENLPEDGTLTTFDINDKTVDVAKNFWNKSPHGFKIRSLIGPALESIKNIKGPIDLVFIDADKSNYLNYLNACVPLLSSKGIIVIDNVLWSGDVLREVPEDRQTPHIKAVNDFVKSNPHFYSTLLPIRDGIMLIKPCS